MSTSPQDIAALLAQLQPTGAPTQPSDVTSPAIAQNASMPQAPIGGQVPPAIAAMLQMAQAPTQAQAPKASRKDQLKETLGNSANTFLYTLGQALSASAEHKGPGATNAGMGAAFTAPFQMQQMRLAQQQAAAKAALEAAQANRQNAQADQMSQLSDAMQALREAQANKANAQANQANSASAEDQMQDFDIGGVKMRLPNKLGVKLAQTQANNDTRLKIANARSSVALLGMGINPATGEQIPDDQLPLPAQKLKATIAELGLKKQVDESLIQYRDAMKDIGSENAATKAQEAQARIAEAARKADQYDQYLQIQRDRINGPTVATRTKADQANVVIGEGDRLIQEINAARDKFGPAAGRINNLQEGIGSADPVVSNLYTHLKSFAALQPALHGSRGIGYQKEFEDAAGGLQRNPDAVIASVKSLQGTARSFANVGGGARSQAKTKSVYNPKTGKIEQVPIP